MATAEGNQSRKSTTAYLNADYLLGALGPSEPDTLERVLPELDLFITDLRGAIYRGQVHHTPDSTHAVQSAHRACSPITP